MGAAIGDHLPPSPACGIETSKARSEKVGMTGLFPRRRLAEARLTPPSPRKRGEGAHRRCRKNSIQSRHALADSPLLMSSSGIISRVGGGPDALPSRPEPHPQLQRMLRDLIP